MSVCRRIVLAAVVATSLTLPALAQKPADDGAERLTAARELMILTGSHKQFDLVIQQMIGLMTAQMVQEKPEHAETIKKTFAEMHDRFVKRKDELIEQVVAIYARQLSLTDMHDLNTFYKSPTGRRFVAAQPGLLRDSMAAGQKWGAQIGAEIVQEAKEELRRRGVDL